MFDSWGFSLSFLQYFQPPENAKTSGRNLCFHTRTHFVGICDLKKKNWADTDILFIMILNSISDVVFCAQVVVITVTWYGQIARSRLLSVFFFFFNVNVRKRNILFCFHWRIINTRIVWASCLGHCFFPWVIFWFTYSVSEYFDHEN